MEDVNNPVKETIAVESVDMMKFIREQTEIINQLRTQLEETKTAPISTIIPAEKVLARIPSLSGLGDLGLPKKVSIRHFVDPESENMGLTQQNLAMIDGAGGRSGFKESFGFIEKAGVKYYLTGFEEPSKNIEKVKDPDERVELIKELAKIKDELSGLLGVDLSCLNYDFWRTMSFEVRTPVKSLNLSDPKDILVYFGILGGAIDSVAPSHEHALEVNKTYKHYLHIDESYEKVKIGVKRERNRAIAILEELYEAGETDKLLMLCKVVLPSTKGFTRKDPIDRLYNDLNDYIHALNVPVDKKITAKKFIQATKEDLEILTKRAVINDAIYNKLLRKNDKGAYYNTETFAISGPNIAEVMAFYMNEGNHDEFTNLYKRVDTVWKGN